MADGYVQVAADGTGKKVDNAELTRADGTVVERQRVAIGDDSDPTKQARVQDGQVWVDTGQYLRALAERSYIELMEQDYRMLAMNERHTGDRQGFEIR